MQEQQRRTVTAHHKVNLDVVDPNLFASETLKHDAPRALALG
jgi:hypothetical protein